MWRKTKQNDPEEMELQAGHRNEEEKDEAVITVTGLDDSHEHVLSKEEKLILLALASLSLMAALDGTSISVALPVCHHTMYAQQPSINMAYHRQCLES